MILKTIDDKKLQINTLKDLLFRSNSESQKKLISKDLNMLKVGDEAEQENAYYLDFAFEKSKNVIVLHDIRLEYKRRIAQFDHILISRFGIELLETKSLKGSMTINLDGSITQVVSTTTNTYPNPLEQSKRHALVLKEFLDDSSLVSKRIEFLGGIEISSKVLIHPKTTITNKELPDGFERADSFVSKRDKEIDSIGIFNVFKLLSKLYNIDKAKEIAQVIIDAHIPLYFDYAKKFRIKKEEVNVQQVSSKKVPTKNNERFCPRCNEGRLVIKKIKSKKAQEKYNNDAFIGCSLYPKCRYTENINS
ncbi:NERD domain-containing protein [Sulfurimonas sp. SAG-AH-194-I05]|nr:NERD domain-containing protein [Sulfurimonas sp. SAG-AH-194-I05]MDF1876002.1 NERD domain-containing protein [Sulfurimonas sp. SAG-AH-194-I05]